MLGGRVVQWRGDHASFLLLPAEGAWLLLIQDLLLTELGQQPHRDLICRLILTNSLYHLKVRIVFLLTNFHGLGRL